MYPELYLGPTYSTPGVCASCGCILWSCTGPSPTLRDLLGWVWVGWRATLAGLTLVTHSTDIWPVLFPLASQQGVLRLVVSSIVRLFHVEGLPVPLILQCWDWTLLRFNFGNRANSDIQGNVCQYTVFILKLILSYLPVYLNDAHPACPTSILLVALKVNEVWLVQSWQLVQLHCQTYGTGSSSWGRPILLLVLAPVGKLSLVQGIFLLWYVSG